MWNDRYATPEYIFGTAPADFLRRVAPLIPAGAEVLCLADGEGRNSVWLAERGCRVTATEPSANALAKARALAAARDVAVDFRQVPVEDWDWRAEAFDAVAGIFIQFAGPDLRARIHAGIAHTLRPGGLVLLHGYALRQPAYGTGGPRDAAHLYDLPALRADFPGWEVLVAQDHDADLNEGTRHVGRSALVDFVARKPGPGMDAAGALR
ncbi:MAG: class I SAM-dependent methyltransferase [Gemmobacter sp.]